MRLDRVVGELHVGGRSGDQPLARQDSTEKEYVHLTLPAMAVSMALATNSSVLFSSSSVAMSVMRFLDPRLRPGLPLANGRPRGAGTLGALKGLSILDTPND